MSDLSLKDARRTFPQGVTVVTVEGDHGPPIWGLGETRS